MSFIQLKIYSTAYGNYNNSHHSRVNKYIFSTFIKDQLTSEAYSHSIYEHWHWNTINGSSCFAYDFEKWNKSLFFNITEKRMNFSMHHWLFLNNPQLCFYNIDQWDCLKWLCCFKPSFPFTTPPKPAYLIILHRESNKSSHWSTTPAHTHRQPGETLLCSLLVC